MTVPWTILSTSTTNMWHDSPSKHFYFILTNLLFHFISISFVIVSENTSKRQKSSQFLALCKYVAGIFDYSSIRLKDSFYFLKNSINFRMIATHIHSYRNMFKMYVTLFIVVIINFMTAISLKLTNIWFHQILVKHGTRSLYRCFRSRLVCLVSLVLCSEISGSRRQQEIILVNLKGNCGVLSYRNAINSECIR